MRFYETDKEFILLKDGEEAPVNLPIYKLHMTLVGSDSLLLQNFNLLIKHWTSYEYPTQMNTSFTYKGFEYRPKPNDISEAELLDFLNDLKAGDFENKIKKSIVESYKHNGIYSIENTIRNIEALTKENEKLKAKIESIKGLIIE